MAVEVILPRVDMDMATGRVARWLVAEGDRVEAGQPIFEIETDKAAMEIDAPAAGVIRALAPAGDAAVPVGTAVAWIVPDGEAFGTPPPAGGSETPAAPAGDARRGEAVPAGTAEGGGNAGAGPAAPDGPAPAPPRPGAVRATPAARRLAREAGAPLAGLVGTGPAGRIQRADVEAALKRLAARPAAPGPGVAIRALRDGAGDPIVLIHGFGAEGATWRPFVGRIGAPNPVLAPDLPGHGASAAVDGGFEALVAAVEAALLDAGLARVHLVGHSLGGAAAAALAAGGALDARSLFLIAPAGLGPRIDAAFLDGFLAAGSEAALAVWMRRLVADPDALPPALVRATLRARSGAPPAAQAALAATLFPGGTQLLSIRAALARLACPVRVVSGLADSILPAGDAADLPPAVALHRLPGVGHMPQLEAPDLVGRLLAETVRSAG